MLMVEEKGTGGYTSPKRRCCIIVLIVLSLLAFAGIGIVAGYFIGRDSAKSCEDNGDTKTPGKTPNRKQTQEQLDQIYKDAVEMVSTKELKENLK